MSQPPQPKVVTTWRDLSIEVQGLRDFYRLALEAAEDLCIAAEMRDETLLSIVLERHGRLKGHGAFKVSKEMFKSIEIAHVN
jgi:hypothetical protein